MNVTCNWYLLHVMYWLNQQVQGRADLYKFLPENHGMIEQSHWPQTNLNCIRHQLTNPYIGSGNWLNILIWLEHLYKCTCNKTDNKMIPQITFLFPVDIATTKQKKLPIHVSHQALVISWEREILSSVLLNIQMTSVLQKQF